MDKSKCIHFVSQPTITSIHNQTSPSKVLDEQTYGTSEKPCYNGSYANTFSFELDEFQKIAISCLERNESVLVAAHTSAGKTAIAEYALAMALRDNQRLIYTSPIKTLSNQKYREFLQKFNKLNTDNNIGLMTGDTTLNPNGNAIVMTTEILRNMLYRGSEILQETAWVVFDEVHYMQDKDRGVVWEETIILLPKNVKKIFLSATLPNTKEFAMWVSQLHNEPCHVVYTEYRPTPLKHYGFALGGDEMYTLRDAEGHFRSHNFLAVCDIVDSFKKSIKRKASIPENVTTWQKHIEATTIADESKFNDIERLVELFYKSEYLPAIFFVFNKRKAEMMGLQLRKLDLTTPEEKQSIHLVFKNAISTLSENDQKLEPIQQVLTLLERGIGVHHSGLLPIIKEVTEILFQESLIKILCATETFSMGVNMPARTVVFTQVKKFDGKVERLLTPGEYIQMSGRAGRRSIDMKGYVVMMLDIRMKEEDCKEMLSGSPDPLKSSFKLTYYTLLNLLKSVEGSKKSMEYIIRNSFQQFQFEMKIPELKMKIEELNEKANEYHISENEQKSIIKYLTMVEELNALKHKTLHELTDPVKIGQFLRPGRFIKVKRWGWSILVSVVAAYGQDTKLFSNKKRGYIIDTIVVAKQETSGNEINYEPCHISDSSANFYIFPISYEDLEDISRLKMVLPSNLENLRSDHYLFEQFKKTIQKYQGKLPNILGLPNISCRESLFNNYNKIASLNEQIQNSAFHETEKRPLIKRTKNKVEIMVELEKLNKELKYGSVVTSFDQEYCARVEILKKLQHIDENNIVLLKGRAACELDATDELLCTELLFEGVFNELDVPSLVSFLSICLDIQEASSEEIQKKKAMESQINKLKETAIRIARISNECKLEVDENEYLETFTFELMDVMYAWSCGSSFESICNMTDIFEGVIVRAVRRLDELMQQLKSAAEIIGNKELVGKLDDGIRSIKRDIMFAPSLYLD